MYEIVTALRNSAIVVDVDVIDLGLLMKILSSLLRSRQPSKEIVNCTLRNSTLPVTRNTHIIAKEATGN